MKLDDLKVYQLAMEIGDEIYFKVDEWDSFQKWTTGKQLVDVADSIAANISEGYGRYFTRKIISFNIIHAALSQKLLHGLLKLKTVS